MSNQKKPNILLITVDQMRYPCTRYPQGGMNKELQDILSFAEVDSDTNSFAKYFPGFMRLRKNSVVLRNHMIASSACVPSRATIYTGQYGTRTRVEETDSLYKYGSDPNFPWLNPKGIPTLGDWFTTAGYSTHYLGKWDLSYVDAEGPRQGDLRPWGFSDWKLCSPDAQGGQLNQLGIYRDPGYVDLVNNFLRRKASNYQDTPNPAQPWLCVASLVNPHDIASAYPLNWWIPEGLTVEDAQGNQIPVAGVQTATDQTSEVRPIPAKGAISNPMPGGTMGIPLNPDDFPQQTFTNPQTLNEDLSTKPDCQFDYAYKMGLALKSRRPPSERDLVKFPFQLQDNADDWFQAYGDFYGYLHYVADRQIDSILQTLDACGLTDDTIVVFLSDHGEYGGAHHGMIEKWHSAYEEILHVPVIVSSARYNSDPSQIKYVDQLTSHIDIVPTLLGMAGYDYEQQQQLGASIKGHTVMDLPGVNLEPTLNNTESPLIDPKNQTREAILFKTDDTITQYLWGEEAPAAYEIFLTEVEEQKHNGLNLATGSITEPNHIRCVRTPEWKLARYWDPTGKQSDQWELYYLSFDMTETVNLVTWDEQGQPIVCSDRIPSDWPIANDFNLQQQLDKLRKLLIKLEEYYLGGPRPTIEPYTLEG